MHVMMKPERAQAGFSVVEVLVSLVVSLLVILGVLQVFQATFRASRTAVDYASLNEQLRAVTGAMTRDVRRSGFWGGATDDLESNAVNNPFTGLSVVDQDGDGTGDCILYGYDADNSGEDAAASHAASEWRAYRFNAATNSIEVATDGGTQAKVTGGACDDGDWTWIDFADPGLLRVTDLRATLTETPLLVDRVVNCPGAPNEEYWTEVRSIVLEVDGQLARDDEARRTTSTVIKVRNDRLFTQTVACP